MKAYGVDGHHPLDHTNGVGDLRSCPVASRFEHGEGGLIPPSYKAMNEYVPVSTTDGEEDTEEKERGGERIEEEALGEGRVRLSPVASGPYLLKLVTFYSNIVILQPISGVFRDES